MPLRPMRSALVAAAAIVVLSGCSTAGGNGLLNAITPYKVSVVQGNFVSKEQVDALQKGMSRDQVRNVLGTPLVTSLFHSDRWDYVFTLKRQGVEPQKRHLTVYFRNDMMDRVEGDPMPSESEFVSTLDTHKRLGKVPRLEATDEELRSFQAKNHNEPAATPAAPAPAPAAPVNYPPLESPSR
ncbi:outer membrane protein assembly factor BamE [Ramlibacter ginsenosidimutans]|uniref:Outer membrane protein assembly factor BamE n=2 Tax=Ramlibacter ginsenosidimutans TaxID=502333 RepID=A0A934WLH7_9BURK|nr:outer membrane protein assembly factor BamE [Ramlibacter ginsenosidimutans]MBK6005433.1 outer membrane protein assembly factor BamE [Ramlibacter ginsenosidimutans]